jgi:hypothetical protein
MPKKRDEQGPYWVQLREAERSIIVFALTHGATIRGTATLLGTSPNFLAGRMRELGIPTPEVKPGPKPGAKPSRPALRVVSGNGVTPEDAPEPEAATADDMDPDDWADDGDNDGDDDGDDDEGDDEGDDDAEDTPENAPEDAPEDDDGPSDEAHSN